MNREQQIAAWEAAIPTLAGGAWRHSLPQEYLNSDRSALRQILAEAARGDESRRRLILSGDAVLDKLPDDAPVFLRMLRHRSPAQDVPAAALALSVAPLWEKDRVDEEKYRRERALKSQVDEEARSAADYQRYLADKKMARVRLRRRNDKIALILAGTLCVTFLVPWTIGRFVLRDRFFRPRGTGVFDAAQRMGASYLLADWLAGMVPLLAFTVLFIVVRSWRGRETALALALVTLIAVTGLTLASGHLWREGEARTAAYLRSTPPKSTPEACGHASVQTGRNKFDDRIPAAIFTLVANRKGAVSGTTCNQVQLFEGQRLVRTRSLGKGVAVVQGPGNVVSVKHAKDLEKATFVVKLRGGDKATYRLGDLRRK